MLTTQTINQPVLPAPQLVGQPKSMVANRVAEKAKVKIGTNLIPMAEKAKASMMLQNKSGPTTAIGKEEKGAIVTYSMGIFACILLVHPHQVLTNKLVGHRESFSQRCRHVWGRCSIRQLLPVRP